MSIQILAIDAASESCSLALAVGDRSFSGNFGGKADRSRCILSAVDEILSGAGTTIRRLDALAVNLGPGSFAGIRVGLGVAKGLIFGTNTPIIGVSSLLILAEKAWKISGVGRVLVSIYAGRGSAYYAQYVRSGDDQVWDAVEKEQMISSGELLRKRGGTAGAWVTAGNGWQVGDGGEMTVCISCEATDMLRLAFERFARDDFRPADAIEANYLHPGVPQHRLLPTPTRPAEDRSVEG